MLKSLMYFIQAMQSLNVFDVFTWSQILKLSTEIQLKLMELTLSISIQEQTKIASNYLMFLF